MRSVEETLTFSLVSPCLNKRRAAKPAVYFGLQCRPGLAGRQPRIEVYNRRHAVARQIVGRCDVVANASDMQRSRHRVSISAKAIAWMAKSLCSYFLLSQ